MCRAGLLSSNRVRNGFEMPVLQLTLRSQVSGADHDIAPSD
jgi:hypothetical protein